MTEPFTNVVQELITQYTLWLPGNQIMSGIGPQVSRSRHKSGSRQTFQVMSWTVRHNGYLSRRIFTSTITSATAQTKRINFSSGSRLPFGKPRQADLRIVLSACIG